MASSSTLVWCSASRTDITGSFASQFDGRAACAQCASTPSRAKPPRASAPSAVPHSTWRTAAHNGPASLIDPTSLRSSGSPARRTVPLDVHFRPPTSFDGLPCHTLTSAPLVRPTLRHRPSAAPRAHSLTRAPPLCRRKLEYGHRPRLDPGMTAILGQPYGDAPPPATIVAPAASFFGPPRA